jgi:hypothetical protein
LWFLDESGFLLIPARRRTWGPEGHPPFVPYNYRHGKISALGTLTVSPHRHRMGLYTRFQKKNFNAVDVASFVRMLLQHLGANLEAEGESKACMYAVVVKEKASPAAEAAPPVRSTRRSPVRQAGSHQQREGGVPRKSGLGNST